MAFKLNEHLPQRRQQSHSWFPAKKNPKHTEKHREDIKKNVLLLVLIYFWGYLTVMFTPRSPLEGFVPVLPDLARETSNHFYEEKPEKKSDLALHEKRRRDHFIHSLQSSVEFKAR